MSEIPNDVRAFMVAQLDSVEALDVLLAMVRREDRGMTSREVAGVVGLGEEATDGFLAHFHACGILEVEPGSTPRFRYRPFSPEIASVIGMLAALHKMKRRQVLAELLGTTDNVRAFSDEKNRDE